MKIFRVTFRYFINSLEQNISGPTVFIMFFSSKLIRYVLFISFLYYLGSGIKLIGNYTWEQMIFFYLVFILVDSVVQMFFREVYRFRPLVISGGFDMVLAKPFPPLVRCLLGGPDYADLGVLVILLAVISYFTSVYIHPSLLQFLTFLMMLGNTFIVATAFHIMVLAIGILTLSVDHLIMVYRDLTALVRIPVDLFTEPVRSLITFVIPVGLMFTFPAKTLLGLLSPSLILFSFIFAICYLIFALKFWRFALKHYSSASS
ncbi:ABC-2 family transporter protein [Candidatus Amesbacteria bacterium]|nr:ABC-2 family transporter protein [Candidatus Amesbacteria bacterium]MBI2587412.1 ABC-2 family transporter protein [Candidatus Amesbacteria bacterium]